MAHPQIYLGQTPDTPQTRRLLRERALRLAALFTRPAQEPTALLLHAQPLATASPVDLLMLRPRAALVGVIMDVEGPLVTEPGGRWRLPQRDETLRGPGGEPPLTHVRQARDSMLAVLERATQQSFARTIGALIIAPTTHPESQIVLDIDEHRQQLKVLGLDELPALATMTQTGIALDEAMLHTVLTASFGARLWHDGTRLLFELGVTPLRLRLLAGGPDDAHVWPLLEGANFVGRRSTPRRYEYRVTLTGDDLMSNDHALIICADDGRVILRDTSTNGTWVALPSEAERRLHRAEQPITPGTTLRMGATQVVLERAENQGTEATEELGK